MRDSSVARYARRVAGTLALSAALLLAAPARATDPVVFSFATVGDSRQDPAKYDPTTLLPNNTGTLLVQDSIWLTNTKAFTRILRSVAAEKPTLLLFNGDMIYGYGRPILPTVTGSSPVTNVWSGANPGQWKGQSTTATITPDFVSNIQQYAYWRGLVANLFETGTYVIPVAGNHETQCSAAKYPYSSASPNPNCPSSKAYADNENAFRANLGDLINDLVANQRFQTVTGYLPANVSGLTSSTAAASSTNNGPITGSQIDLSYSFDITTSNGIILHFAIINTDPSGADGIAPTDWLANDLANATTHANGAPLKIFVFGHKPAFTYNYNAASGGTVAAGGLDATSPISYRNNFWSVIAKYNATYFCGHEHIPNVASFADPTGTNTAHTPYQVIVGSGGSPFDDALVGPCPGCSEPTFTHPSDRFYAWAFVQVHQSGTVDLFVNGFSDSYGTLTPLTYYNVTGLQ